VIRNKKLKTWLEIKTTIGDRNKIKTWYRNLAFLPHNGKRLSTEADEDLNEEWNNSNSFTALEDNELDCTDEGSTEKIIKHQFLDLQDEGIDSLTIAEAERRVDEVFANQKLIGFLSMKLWKK
jgi:hypothetical protein